MTWESWASDGNGSNQGHTAHWDGRSSRQSVVVRLAEGGGSVGRRSGISPWMEPVCFIFRGVRFQRPGELCQSTLLILKKDVDLDVRRKL